MGADWGLGRGFALAMGHSHWKLSACPLDASPSKWSRWKPWGPPPRPVAAGPFRRGRQTGVPQPGHVWLSRKASQCTQSGGSEER